MLYIFARMRAMEKTKRYKDLALLQLFIGLGVMLASGIGLYYCLQKSNLFYFTLVLVAWFFVGIFLTARSFHFSKLAKKQEKEKRSLK